MIMTIIVAIVLVAIVYYAVTLIPDSKAQNVFRVIGTILILLWLLTRLAGTSAIF